MVDIRKTVVFATFSALYPMNVVMLFRKNRASGRELTCTFFLSLDLNINAVTNHCETSSV